MKQIHRIFWLSALVLVLAVGEASAAERYEPTGLFLTWQRDPTTTMTIDWQTPAEAEQPTAVQYRLLEQENDTGREWREASGATRPFPFSDRQIHRVELTELKPGSTYEFRIRKHASLSRVYRFRTMPRELDRPVRFAQGGDTNPGGFMRRSSWHALRYDVDFIVWGGDLAYANAKESSLHRWYHWFESTDQSLVTDDGRVVPVVLCIGNHEVRGRPDEEGSTREWRENSAPYFYSLFAFPGHPGYRALDFGDYLSLIALDSGHTNPIVGDQTDWLAEALDERAGNVRHIIPFYHVASYPSHRSYDSGPARAIRENWAPLFEKAGVRLAFEHNDHTYKRTPPIRDEKIDRDDGITYLGDGAWGVGGRKPHAPEDTWYLERAAQSHHAIIVTLDGDDFHALVIATDYGDAGKIIDEYPKDTDAEVLRLEPKRWNPRPDLPRRETQSVRDKQGAQIEVAHKLVLPEEDWRFKLDPHRRGHTRGWHKASFDDSAWSTFHIGEHWTRDEAYRTYAGPAWYRRTIELPEKPGNLVPDQLDAVELAFEGVDEMAWVWVNGRFVGQHAIGPEGWEMPFALPVTDAVKWGEPNQITIMAESTQDGGGVHGEVRFELLRVTSE